MKKFKFTYKPYIYLLLSFALAFSIAGFIWNIFNIIEYYNIDKFKTVSYFIICLIALLLSIFILSIIISGKYYIKNENLYCAFGFYIVKEKIENITEAVRFSKNDKLVLYYKDGKYNVIFISPDKYDDFIASLLKVNKNIAFSIDVKEK